MHRLETWKQHWPLPAGNLTREVGRKNIRNYNVVIMVQLHLMSYFAFVRSCHWMDSPTRIQGPRSTPNKWRKQEDQKSFFSIEGDQVGSHEGSIPENKKSCIITGPDAAKSCPDELLFWHPQNLGWTKSGGLCLDHNEPWFGLCPMWKHYFERFRKVQRQEVKAGYPVNIKTMKAN